MSKNTCRWLRGLISAGISGVTTVISTMIVAPEQFHFNAGLKNVIIVSIASGVVSIAKYLQLTPLPDEDTTTTPSPV